MTLIQIAIMAIVAFITTVNCGFFWAYGGDHGGQWRGGGASLSIWLAYCLTGVIVGHNLVLAGMVIVPYLWMATSLGYGEHAPLTRYVKLRVADPYRAQLIIRGVCGLCYGFSISLLLFFSTLFLLITGLLTVLLTAWLVQLWSVRLPARYGNFKPIIVGSWVMNTEELLIGVSVGAIAMINMVLCAVVVRV